MAHLTQMAGAISDYAQRKKVSDTMQGPMPKLGIGYLPASEIESSYSLLQLYKATESLENVDPHGYTKPTSKKHYGALYPVTVRMLNLDAAMAVTPMDYIDENGVLDKTRWKEKEKEVAALQSQMADDLVKLGSKALLYNHYYQHPTGKWEKQEDGHGSKQITVGVYQRCIALPCSYPNNEPHTTAYDDNPHWQELNKDSPKQHFTRDVKGAGILLAYMMAKNIISPEDIEQAYGHSFLVEACKKDNVQLLKDRLGLELALPTAQKVMSSNRTTNEINIG